jgi:hydrogenase nickel incorporation protein HypB
VEQDILSRNTVFAESNRRRIAGAGAFAINLVSSPGSGKTTLLTTTIGRLKSKASISVIEGDQQTSIDADRIRQTGVNAIQINTGRGCHLDGHMIAHALDSLNLQRDGILFIENVGNLVCPAAFDLGENHKVAILSVTEGDDKPLKYPDMFAAADLMLISKSDLLPYVDFEVDRCAGHARAINPRIGIITLSARTGDGMGEWVDWLLASSRKAGRTEMDVGRTHA